MLILFLLTQIMYSTKSAHNENFSKTFIGKCFSHCCLRQWVIVRVNNRLTQKFGRWEYEEEAVYRWFEKLTYSWEPRKTFAYFHVEMCTYPGLYACSGETWGGPRLLLLIDLEALNKWSESKTEIHTAWLCVKGIPQHTHRWPIQKLGDF